MPWKASAPAATPAAGTNPNAAPATTNAAPAANATPAAPPVPPAPPALDLTQPVACSTGPNQEQIMMAPTGTIVEFPLTDKFHALAVKIALSSDSPPHSSATILILANGREIARTPPFLILGSFGQHALLCRAQSGSFGQASCCSCPNIVFTMVLPVGFVCGSWLRLRKMSETIAHPEPSQSPVRRIAGITISSPHTPRTKARRSKPHRALITVLKDALLCMSRASFARKICSAKFCSAVSTCSSAKLQHSATEYLRLEIAVAAAASSEPRPEERASS